MTPAPLSPNGEVGHQHGPGQAGEPGAVAMVLAASRPLFRREGACAVADRPGQLAPVAGQLAELIRVLGPERLDLVEASFGFGQLPALAQPVSSFAQEVAEKQPMLPRRRGLVM